MVFKSGFYRYRKAKPGWSYRHEANVNRTRRYGVLFCFFKRYLWSFGVSWVSLAVLEALEVFEKWV